MSTGVTKQPRRTQDFGVYPKEAFAVGNVVNFSAQNFLLYDCDACAARKICRAFPFSHPTRRRASPVGLAASAPRVLDMRPHRARTEFAPTGLGPSKAASRQWG